MSCADIFLGCIAILFPPIAVWIKTGLCSGDSVINILLCLLGYLPGLLHAWYIIAKFPEHDTDYERLDQESGPRQRVTYYYISDERNQRGYGTAGRPKNSSTAHTVSGNRPSAPLQGNSNAGSGTSGESSSRPTNEGSGDAPPPSYSDVVKGDHKIQSQE